MRIAAYRKAHFNAAHRLHNPAWPDEKNREVFGLCNNPNYHGHNYELVVAVTGEIDPVTGYVVDLGTLSSLVKREILGSGSLFTIPLFGEGFEPWVIMVLPPGGFFTLAFLLIVFKWWKTKRTAPG